MFLSYQHLFPDSNLGCRFIVRKDSAAQEGYKEKGTFHVSAKTFSTGHSVRAKGQGHAPCPFGALSSLGSGMPKGFKNAGGRGKCRVEEAA